MSEFSGFLTPIRWTHSGAGWHWNRQDSSRDRRQKSPRATPTGRDLVRPAATDRVAGPRNHCGRSVPCNQRGELRHRQGRSRIFGLLLWLLALAGGCGPQAADPPPSPANNPQNPVKRGPKPASQPAVPQIHTAARFQDRTSDSGVDFRYSNGEDSEHFTIVESLGGGAALLDFDGDSHLDLFLPGGGVFEGQQLQGVDSGLYRNLGASPSWRFRNVAVAAGVAEAPYYSHGAAVGDYDNDGMPDVLVTGYGGLTLFHNMGDGTFVELSQPAGLHDDLWSSSAAWGDVDGDGQLDLYVVHYVDWSFENHPFCKGPQAGLREICPPRQFQPLPDTLYLNNGDGTFRDATQTAGLSAEGKGLGVVIADLDLDGQPDIYVANDTVPNNLYRNLGQGRFEDIGLVSGTSRGDTGVPDGSMGVEVGDFNNDGRPDIFVANYERESFALYRNDGGANFTHVSQRTGITALGGLYVGWGTALFDFDADGDEDVFISNGHVIRYPQGSTLAQKPILLENQDGQRFVNVATAAGPFFQQDHMGRGVAVGDIDNDGDCDLVVVRSNATACLLSNETQTQNGWVAVRLVGTTGIRDPTGAVLFLETTSGRQMRMVKGGTSYASTRDPRVFFGLGDSHIQRLEIRWPGGQTQIVTDLARNQLHTIIEPSTTAANQRPPTQNPPTPN